MPWIRADQPASVTRTAGEEKNPDTVRSNSSEAGDEENWAV